jgi:hypothetical protein
MDFGICFFDKRNPKLIVLATPCKDNLPALRPIILGWEKIIDDDVAPFIILEESEHIDTELP